MPTKAQMRLTLITVALVGVVVGGIVRPWAARHSTDDGVSGLVGDTVNGWM